MPERGPSSVEKPLGANTDLTREVKEDLEKLRQLLTANTLLTIRDDRDRARRVGEPYADEQSRRFAEVLIDLEEERVARAFVVGMLRETWGPRNERNQLLSRSSIVAVDSGRAARSRVATRSAIVWSTTPPRIESSVDTSATIPDDKCAECQGSPYTGASPLKDGGRGG